MCPFALHGRGESKFEALATLRCLLSLRASLSMVGLLLFSRMKFFGELCPNLSGGLWRWCVVR
jgi:hypothetical protein